MYPRRRFLCRPLIARSRFGAALPLALVTTLLSLSTFAGNAGNSHSAVAIQADNPALRFEVTEQPNLAVAAAAALAACSAGSPASAKRCELIALDETRLQTAQQLRAAAAGPGSPLFLWRMHSGRSTVYLGGTIHQLKATFYPLDAGFEQAFQAADTLVVEVDLRRYPQEQIQQETMKRALLPPTVTLDTLLTDDQRRALIAIGAHYGIETAQLQQLSPMLVSQQLAVTSLATLGYAPGNGVETYFVARAGDRQVLELETLTAQLDLLFNQPLTTQLALLTTMLEQFDTTVAWLEGLVQAWLSGNTDQFEALFRKQSGDSPAARAFERALLDERNKRMADRVMAYLEHGSGTYLVLVGAAHLVGKQGLLALLQAAGYQAEQLRRATGQNGTEHVSLPPGSPTLQWTLASKPVAVAEAYEAPRSAQAPALTQ